MLDFHQKLMDEFYHFWQLEENCKLSQEAVLEKFDSKLHKAAVILGNFNYQVENGGFEQWIFNGYYVFIDELIDLLMIGSEQNIKYLNRVLGMVQEIRDAIPDMDDLIQCSECGGIGYLIDNDNDEYICEECNGDGKIELSEYVARNVDFNTLDSEYYDMEVLPSYTELLRYLQEHTTETKQIGKTFNFKKIKKGVVICLN